MAAERPTLSGYSSRFGWWAWRQGFASPSHRQLVLQAQQVRTGGPDLAGLGHAYPPMPTLIAILVPAAPSGSRSRRAWPHR